MCLIKLNKIKSWMSEMENKLSNFEAIFFCCGSGKSKLNCTREIKNEKSIIRYN